MKHIFFKLDITFCLSVQLKHDRATQAYLKQFSTKASYEVFTLLSVYARNSL